MSDKKNDKLNIGSGKKTTSDNKADDALNKAYEKALTQKRPLTKEEHKIFLRQQQAQRREQRLKEQKISRRQNNIRSRGRKKSIDNDNLNHDFDDDVLNHNNKEIYLNQDNHSDDGQGNHNGDNNHNLDMITPKAQKTSTPQEIMNKQNYIKLLAEFTDNYNNLSTVESDVKKAMVFDTITQMFDQFIMGMNEFSKDTKQHHVFGRGANLCQKILRSLKNDNIPEAQELIKKIIPKR